MRFHHDGPEIPDLLFERCEEGNVVFLCGAGVSMTSGMPSFIELVTHVISHFSPSVTSQIMKAFAPWTKPECPEAALAREKIPLDRIFSMLHQEYGRDDVNTVVTRRLTEKSTAKNVGDAHRWIKRISLNECGKPQVVTTNFDLLFELGERLNCLPVHVPPALPDPALGLPIGGVIYLHGRLSWPHACGHHYILSNSDFGRAYLSKGWAAKFINGLVENYTVVFVGYQAEDPPMKYLLEGLNWDGQFDRTKLFAFDKGKLADIESKWRDKGVTPIPYNDHDQLWQTMKAWAERAADPREWRRKVLATAKRDPKEMLSYERGQVVHFLRSVSGANLFSDDDPLPHPEWVCVLDAATRTAKASYSFDEVPKKFDPAEAYGLDDDVVPTTPNDYRKEIPNEHLLEWRQGDGGFPKFHRLGDREVEGRESMPLRLQHLTVWIAKLYSSPVIAWWAARQNGLHPRLIDRIDYYLCKDSGIDKRCWSIWNLILESHRDSRNHSIRGQQFDSGWHNLIKRLKMEGWTSGALREFRRVCQPRLCIQPPIGLHATKPPTSDWAHLHLHDICQFEVEYLDQHSKELDITDEVLSTVFAIMENHLSTVAGMLSEIQVPFFNTPSSHSKGESEDNNYLLSFVKPFRLFITLLDRLVVLDFKIAKAHVISWNESDEFFFRKFKLYALSKTELFSADEMAIVINSFDQDVIWDIGIVRELLFALVVHWSRLSRENKIALARRILGGPDKKDHWSDSEYPNIRDRWAALYGRYLQLEGCDFPEVVAAELTEIIARIPNWNDSWAESVADEQKVLSGLIETDEASDVFEGLSLSEIVPRAKDELERDLGSLTEKRPFVGLVKTNPVRALRAIIFEAREDKFADFAWATLIKEFPTNVRPRVYYVFLNRLTRMPNDLIIRLRHSIGWWLYENLEIVLEFDTDLGWRVYDHFVEAILTDGLIEDEFGEEKISNEINRRSKRTDYYDVINKPLGMCIQALLVVVHKEKRQPNSTILFDVKWRMDRLLIKSNVVRDYTISILMSELEVLMRVFSTWSIECLVPMLKFEHAASDSAWSGLLNSTEQPSAHVTRLVSHLLLKLYPWIQRFDWQDKVSERAASWVASMYISIIDEFDKPSDDDMRDALRAMSDLARNQVIFWLYRIRKEHGDDWCGLIIPFITNVWPREIVYRTNASVSRWLHLLDNSGDDFPAVYKATKRLLVPIDIDSVALYRIVQEVEGMKPIATRYPEDTLDLMNTLTSEKLSLPSEDLSRVLALIVEASKELARDPRYRRLIDLVERV